jgi:ABC-2 type transport system ATP-binding protein
MSMPDAESLPIQVENLGLHYESPVNPRQYRLFPTHPKAALQGLNLRVPAGAVVGLVGRNGAGKSSLLRCLVGLAAPQTGRCILLGAPSMDLPDAVRARLGYVAQAPDLFDWLDGYQHLQRFSALYPGFDELRALALAVRLDLPMRTRAGRLSGGDQQKLSVLLALAHDPDLLILDEPVASMDPLARRDFMRALFERRGADQPPRTVLISSHLLNDLERVVTHVAFLREGQLQLMDEWDALAEHVRLLELPSGATALPQGAGVLHRRRMDGRERVLFDARLADAPPAAGRPLGLDELFAELNA